jgi:hypothetical protein
LDVVDFNRSHIKCGWIYSKSSSTHESKYSNKNHPFQGLGPSWILGIIKFEEEFHILVMLKGGW